MPYSTSKPHHFHFRLTPEADKLLTAVRVKEGRFFEKLMEISIAFYAQKHYPELYKTYLESCNNATS